MTRALVMRKATNLRPEKCCSRESFMGTYPGARADFDRVFGLYRSKRPAVMREAWAAFTEVVTSPALGRMVVEAVQRHQGDPEFMPGLPRYLRESMWRQGSTSATPDLTVDEQGRLVDRHGTVIRDEHGQLPLDEHGQLARPTRVLPLSQADLRFIEMEAHPEKYTREEINRAFMDALF
jgi:hypothetical protein